MEFTTRTFPVYPTGVPAQRHKDVCPRMFIKALFVIANRQISE